MVKSKSHHGGIDSPIEAPSVCTVGVDNPRVRFLEDAPALIIADSSPDARVRAHVHSHSGKLLSSNPMSRPTSPVKLVGLGSSHQNPQRKTCDKRKVSSHHRPRHADTSCASFTVSVSWVPNRDKSHSPHFIRRLVCSSYTFWIPDSTRIDTSAPERTVGSFNALGSSPTFFSCVNTQKLKPEVSNRMARRRIFQVSFPGAVTAYLPRHSSAR